MRNSKQFYAIKKSNQTTTFCERKHIVLWKKKKKTKLKINTQVLVKIDKKNTYFFVNKFEKNSNKTNIRIMAVPTLNMSPYFGPGYHVHGT